MSMEKKNSKGEIKPIGRWPGQSEDHLPGYGEDTAFDVLMQFGANKSAPIPGYVLRAMQQTKTRDFNYGTEAAKMWGPMYAPDIEQAYEEHGNSGLWSAIPSALGFGVQTYDSNSKKKSSKKEDWEFDDKEQKPSKKDESYKF